MTVEEMEARIEELEEQNKNLRMALGNLEDEYIDPDDYDERMVNMRVAERLAEEDRRNDERAAEDPDFAYELRCIRYLESRYDDDYGW